MSENQNVRRVAIGAYSAYAIAVKYGYTGTEEEWIKEVEANRIRAEEAAEKAEGAVEKAVQKAVDEGLFKGDKGADAEVLTWTLLEQITTTEDTAAYECLSDTAVLVKPLKGIKVMLYTGSSQNKGTLNWTCTLENGSAMTGSVPLVASSASTSPPTRTFAQFQILPFFGHYLALAGSAATGIAPTVTFPADFSGTELSTDSPITSFTLTAASGSVPLRSGAQIKVWAVV